MKWKRNLFKNVPLVQNLGVSRHIKENTNYTYKNEKTISFNSVNNNKLKQVKSSSKLHLNAFLCPFTL